MKKAMFISSIIVLSSLLVGLIAQAAYWNTSYNSSAEALTIIVYDLASLVAGLSTLTLSVLAIVNYFIKPKGL